MKLIRYGQIGQEKPGVQLKDGTRIDVSGFGLDYDDQFFGNNEIENLSKWVEENKEKCKIINLATISLKDIFSKNKKKIIQIGEVNPTNNLSKSNKEFTKSFSNKKTKFL